MTKPTRTVYCYYFPEVRSEISKLAKAYPHDIYLQSISPGLDDFHNQLLETYCEVSAPWLPGLKTFPFRYYSAGASEAIFHILASLAAKNDCLPLYVFEGEYEGYEGYGSNVGLHFTRVKRVSNVALLKPGIFFLSNPNAFDGNIIDNAVVEAMGAAGHQIVLDVTYVGMTMPHAFLVDRPFISHVIVSLSKPYGLYYYRVGMCFSRQEMPTLLVNKWFKNIFSIVVGTHLLKTIPLGSFEAKYRPLQIKAIDRMGKEMGLRPRASDVFLLASLSHSDIATEDKTVWKDYDRGFNYRFCLTPYFLEEEGMKNIP